VITETWKCDGCGDEQETKTEIDGWWRGLSADDDPELLALACGPDCIAGATTEEVSMWARVSADEDDE
jgi:hypothetical protein